MITTCGNATLCQTSHLKMFIHTSHYVSWCHQCIFIIAFMNLHMSWKVIFFMPFFNFCCLVTISLIFFLQLFISVNSIFLSLAFTCFFNQSSFLPHPFLVLPLSSIHCTFFISLVCTNNVFHIDVSRNYFFLTFQEFQCILVLLFIAIEMISTCWRSCFSMGKCCCPWW